MLSICSVIKEEFPADIEAFISLCASETCSVNFLTLGLLVTFANSENSLSTFAALSDLPALLAESSNNFLILTFAFERFILSIDLLSLAFLLKSLIILLNSLSAKDGVAFPALTSSKRPCKSGILSLAA